MKFSVVTPSFRSSQWLKLCIASVADQGVEVEHIVQDAASDDDTQHWLPHDQRVKAFIEKDGGMYDAINRGYRRASGDILSHLNSDEQYLPGALAAVGDFFAQNPGVEVVFGGAVVTDHNGHYLCHRLPLIPRRHEIWFRLPVLTCSLFIRRRVVHERGLFFDTQWRALGDLHWVAALIQNGVPMSVLPGVQSVFTDTGDNLGASPSAHREYRAMLARVPVWVRALRPILVLQNQLRRVAAGHLSLEPTSYSIYTLQSSALRVAMDVPKPTAFWKNRGRSAGGALRID